MSQRPSGYQRIKNDKYETPIWAIEVLEPHIPNRILDIFDPCCGSGNVIKALGNFKPGRLAWGKDLERNGYDFLQDESWHDAIITNPPYGLAEEFIRHALTHSAFVAMLLRCDYHHAKTRRYLFKEDPWFSKIIALTERLVFVKRTDGKKEAPSFNHSWFIWDACQDNKKPVVTWAP